MGNRNDYSSEDKDSRDKDNGNSNNNNGNNHNQNRIGLRKNMINTRNTRNTCQLRSLLAVENVGVSSMAIVMVISMIYQQYDVKNEYNGYSVTGSKNGNYNSKDEQDGYDCNNAV